MLDQIRRLGALSGAERTMLVRAFVLLVLIDLGLRIRGFRRIAGWAPRVSESRADAAAFQQANLYAHWIDIAARHYVLPARCLPRSLALHVWLRREGIASELRIGVHRQAGDFTAHAWVELDGRPANEQPGVVAAFRPLAGPFGQGPDWSGVKWTSAASPRTTS